LGGSLGLRLDHFSFFSPLFQALFDRVSRSIAILLVPAQPNDNFGYDT
jgi:hypothetical protein